MMAGPDDVPFSLLSLGEELTCSICLSPFDCPVTIPCGHNFCQDCLLATWKDSYSCPQCRTHFSTKPELKKNTVLSTVVETFNMRSSKSEAGLESEEIRAEKRDVIRCDTCMEAEASKTCLTCMASYCEEHLRPHRENPKFSVHQLSEPVGDLSERICSDHHKLMDFFCSKHGRPICSFCLQQDHKCCSFMSPEEQKSLKEVDLRDKLGLLNGKIEKTESVIFQMKDMQGKLKNAATNRKTALAAVYQQMRDLLVQEEREAQHEVDYELDNGLTKLQDIMERLTENAEKMTKAKEDVSSLLSQSENLAFLQVSFDLPRAVKFEPHVPRITLDSKKVTASQTFAAALKEHLTEMLKQPVEARLPMLKPDEAAPVPATNENTQSESQSVPEPPQPRPPNAGCPPTQPYFQPVPVPVYIGAHTGWNPPQHPPSSYSGPRFPTGQKTYPQKTQEKKTSPGKKVVCKPTHKVTRNKAGETKSHAAKKDPQKSQEKKTSPGKKVVCKQADKATPKTAEETKSHTVKTDKKSDTSHQNPHKQDKRPPSAAGGSKTGPFGPFGKESSFGFSFPKESSSGFSFLKESSSGFSFPKESSSGFSFPKESSSGFSFPKESSSGFSFQKESSSGFSFPKGPQKPFKQHSQPKKK